MTHLSDFTFLARAIADFCVLLWSIIHMHSTDRFETLRWSVIKKKDVKSIMTILFLLSLTLLLIYDIICTKIKYTEGYVVEPLTKNIISKPSQEWSPENKSLRHVATRILMLAYALENSAVFLLQNLWNYLANKLANVKFITTWQFRVNYVFIFITLVGFPCLPTFLESNDNDKLEYSNVKELGELLRKHTYEEVIPELAAASSNLIILIYGLMAHFKFSALIRRDNNNPMMERLKYYQHMNILLILIITLNASSVVIFSIDALTETQYLNRHKFTSDLIAGIINFSVSAFFIVWLMIFYPHSPCNGYSKLQSPIAPPTSEPPGRKKSLGTIEVKIDSITTTIKVDENYTNKDLNSSNYYNINDDKRYNHSSNYYNINNNKRHNLQDNHVQVPLALVTNNKEVYQY